MNSQIGSVWAPELAKHDGRYYCYIPARFTKKRSIYLIHAEQIQGPWSEPVDLHLPALLSLRSAFYWARSGEARFANFTYRAL